MSRLRDFLPPASDRERMPEVDCKPGPVPAAGYPAAGEGHSSRRRVTAPLEHSHPSTGPSVVHRRASGGPPSSVPLFKLAPGGACLAASRLAVARRLLPHDFTLTCASAPGPHRALRLNGHRRCHFCCAFPRVTPGRCYRPPCPVEPGLSSRGRCLSAGDLPSTSGPESVARLRGRKLAVTRIFGRVFIE